MGDMVVILGHHYQRREIVDLSDFRGDSLELARRAAGQQKAKYIVFCGVNFMAESAAILAQPKQIIIHPDLTAGCPMADMARLSDVQETWQQLENILGPGATTPITYVNSNAAIKAFCGRNDGITCTSSNARSVIVWALKRRKKFLFLPDEHLGRNSSRQLGIPRRRIIAWDPALPMGGNRRRDIENAVAILWKGFCHVHTFFTVDHVREARKKYKNPKIIVHPECPEEVVLASDENGSTGFIVRYAENAAKSATIVIGTEINLVSRLALEYQDKNIYELARSLCPNMYRINLQNLLYSLQNLGKVNVVRIDDETKHYARIALERMLSIK